MERLFLTGILVCSGIFGLVVTLWGGYYLLTGIMSWKKPVDCGWHPARTRFAILIAARNEELVIGPLINSLLMQEYPKEQYDIWVIPNNCTDNTALAAKNFGAKVLNCPFPVHSKGEVLRFAYDRLRGRGYDAWCVFDADNIVDKRFLAEMNNAYLAGAPAAQGYRDSKNPYDTAISGCCSIYYWMMNRFHNGGKSGMGLSAMIGGTGFMVSSRMLEKLGGWHSSTISEDLELTAQCIMAGEKVWWVPRAVTYDEQPLTYAQSAKQRKRWSSGTLQVGERYLPGVGSSLWSDGGVETADLGATLLLPAYQVAAAANLLVSAVAAALLGRSVPQALAAFWGVIGCNLALTVLFSTLAAGIVVLAEQRWDRRLWKGVALYWLFLLSWLPITVGSFVKKTVVWEEIKHTRTALPEAMTR